MQEQPQTAQAQVASSNIEVKDTETKVDLTGGVENGTVEKNDPTVPAPVRERIDHGEKVVHETDKDGNVTGWHKEAGEGGNQ